MFLKKSCVAHIVPYVCLRIVVDNYLQLLTQFACFFIITLSPKRLHPIRIAVSQVIKENCGDNYSLLCWYAEPKSVNEKDCQNTLWAPILHLNNLISWEMPMDPGKARGLAPSPSHLWSVKYSFQSSVITSGRNGIASLSPVHFLSPLPSSTWLLRVHDQFQLLLFILQCNDLTFRR